MALQVSYTDIQGNVYPKAYARVRRIVFERTPGEDKRILAFEVSLYKDTASAKAGTKAVTTTTQVPVDGAPLGTTAPVTTTTQVLVPTKPILGGAVVTVYRDNDPKGFDAAFDPATMPQAAQIYAYLKASVPSLQLNDGTTVNLTGATDV